MAVLLYSQQAEDTVTRSGNTTEGKRRKSRRRRASNSPVDGELNLQQYLPGHFDYITDVITDQENRLADAINSADCRAGKAKLDVLYTLSRVSGVLAARKMNLKQCQSLKSLGQTAIIRQCSTLVLEYGVDNSSKCRPQPRSGKFGISNDGFTLVPYTECYWGLSAVYFNGHAFEARDGKWALSKVSWHAKRHVLLAHFSEQQLSGNIHSRTICSRKLSGTMEEHGLDDVGVLVEAVEQTG